MRDQFRFRPAIVAAWLCLFVLTGCSGRDARPVAAAPRRESPLPSATTAADLAAAAAQPTIRPVPEVVSRPRPFRLPATLATPAASLSPVTLAAATLPEPAAPGAARAAAPPAADAIRDMLRGYLRAFNEHDAEAVAAHWTGSAESVDLASGEVTAGRDAVRSVFTALFAEDDAAKIDIDVSAIRQVRDDVAVVDGVTLLSFADGTSSGSRFTAVVVNEGGRWMLESVREAPHAVAGRPLDALAWLVGSWEDDGAGVTASTQSFWSAGRAFLVRTHSVAEDAAATPAEGDDEIPGLLPPGDAGQRELTEIIGWDPERRVVRSWLFSSAGRFGEATWSREGDAWRLHVAGRGADEGLECLCTIEPVGPDRLELRCEGDGLAGLLPPACSFVRTARLGGPPAP